MLLKKMHYKCETAHPSLQTRDGWGSTHFEWLKKVLEVISEYKVSRLYELLPQNLEL